MKKTILTTLFSLSFVTPLAGIAQMSEEDAAAAQKTRHSVFELLSFSMEPLAGMARGTTEFDQEKATENAERIIMLARLIPEVFAADTRGSGVDSRANHIIWDNFGSFTDRANDLAQFAGELKEAAASGDQRALAGAVRSTGQACGACHDLFRLEE